MNIIVNNLQDRWKEELFQCGGFLDMQIGMEPLVIDWAKEEPKKGQIMSRRCGQNSDQILIVPIFNFSFCFSTFPF